jgi:hypothetical protein
MGDNDVDLPTDKVVEVNRHPSVRLDPEAREERDERRSGANTTMFSIVNGVLLAATSLTKRIGC